MSATPGETKATYTRSAFIAAGGVYNLGQLLNQVANVGLSVSLLIDPECFEQTFTTLTLCFDGPLSGPDADALDNLVATHDGEGEVSADGEVVNFTAADGVTDFALPQSTLFVDASGLANGESYTLTFDANDFPLSYTQTLVVAFLGAGATFNLVPLNGSANSTADGNNLPLPQALYLVVRVPDGFVVGQMPLP